MLKWIRSKQSRPMYEHLGNLDCYVNMECTLTLRCTRVGKHIYVIPYDEFQWNNKTWYIEHEKDVHDDLILHTLDRLGYEYVVDKLNMIYDDRVILSKLNKKRIIFN